MQNETKPHPPITEPDAGSYLDGTISEHDVLHESAEGLHCDGAPAYRHQEFYGGADLCRSCAYRVAAALGFTGPVALPISFQTWLPCESEEVMVQRDGDRITSIAHYGYGRAFFDVGEERTAPCDQCGAETLIEA